MHDALNSGSVVGGYRLLRPLGRGAQSTVYLAESVATAMPVALKVVALPATGEGAARAAFLRGAETARRLVHPGIVALYGAGIDGKLAWLAMEPVPGGDIERYTLARRLLPLPLVLAIGRRVAEALAYAHHQGVVHRDLKPANVLVDWPSDTVKLADLGLAREDDASRTATGLVPGTPAYMAPEQLAGGVPTAATDLYALGVMLFQLLAGRLPHEGATMGELLRQVVSEPAPDLRALQTGTPPALAELVTRLLAKRAALRPADAQAVAAALAACAGAAGGGTAGSGAN